ncbi:MAG: ABC transporter permease [Thermoplasmatales archaeon]|nr:MAG: ABC transporter permease [Thermoplasmatales archaeon]
MSALSNIIIKELRELLTPASILPIIIIALIFGSIGSSMEGIREGFDEQPVLGYIDEDNNYLSTIVTTYLNNNSKVIFNSTDIADKSYGLDQVKQKQGVALIIIKQNFSRDILNDNRGEIDVYWIMRGAGLFDAVSSEVVEGTISSLNKEISKILIQNNTTINASIALWPTSRIDTTYFKDREIGLSPGAITSMLASQSTFMPIVIMMLIIFAGQMIISSMALEKENKTLETLLTLPVKRTSIVTGKIAASAFIGLLFAVIYMFGMRNYFQGFQMSEALNLADYGLILTSQDFVLVGISLFIALISALALCMFLGTFAKNYKSAQTLVFPVTMLAMIPMFITMFADFDTLPLALKGLLFAIPFSHPMMATRALIFNDYLLVISGIIYVSIFAIVTISIVVWVFKTDRLLTGSTRRKKIWMFKKKRI